MHYTSDLSSATLEKANVPVWFYWDTSSTSTQFPHGIDTKYKPSALEIQQAKFPNASGIGDATALNGPPPASVPGSGQLSGEGPNAYRERYLICHKKKIQNETAEEKQI